MAKKNTKKVEAAPKGVEGKTGNNEQLVFGTERYRSPKGKAQFAYLDKPDTTFSKSGPGLQKIELIMDPTDPEVKTMVAELLAFENAQLKLKGKPELTSPSCLKITPEGMILARFKRTAKTDEAGKVISVPTVDAAKNTIRPVVWRDSLVRVGYSVCFWTVSGKHGLKLYLNAVQVLEASKSGGQAADTIFDVEKDHVKADDADVPEEGSVPEIVEEEEVSASDLI